MKTITVDQFISYFAANYPHVQHELNRKQIYDFLKRVNFRGVTIKLAASQFCDMLLANGLADVQE